MCRESKKGQCSVQGVSSIRNIVVPSPCGAAEGAVPGDGGSCMQSPLRPRVWSAQGTHTGGRKRCMPTLILFFPAAASRGLTPAGVQRARGLSGVVSMGKGSPWQRRAEGAQWIRRSEWKTSDTDTEGWRARGHGPVWKEAGEPTGS